MSLENVDVNGNYCYINNSTASESKNHNYIDYKKKINEMFTNIYLMENNGYHMVST